MKKTKIFYGNQYVDSFYCTGKKNVKAMCNAQEIEKHSERQLAIAGFMFIGFIFLALFISL